MKTYGLIGWPLGHSFSASFFADKFQREHIDAQYLNFAMPTVDGVATLLNSHEELCGFNVTIPHKQAILSLLDDVTPEARAIGAVNVVRVRRFDDGRHYLKGYNTDVVGFVRSLLPLLRPHHRAALILGTGGASRAVVHGLQQMGIATTYVSRTAAEGRLTYGDLNADVMQQHTVIVNCSPVGMYPHVNECPDIPYDLLTEQHLLYDLVYNPEETLFLRRGAEHGATVKNGLEMLHLQALAAWDIWQAP